MTREQAREELADVYDLSSETLYNKSPYISADADDDTVCLDGEFSADTLEAIAMWLRDPTIGEPG